MQLPRDDYRLAISHSSADIGVAKLISLYAKKLGASCFLDEWSIGGGADFRHEIINQIRNAHELLVLVTPKFLESRWLDFEVGVAAGAGLWIVPMSHCVAPGQRNDLPTLKNMQWRDLDDAEKYFKELEKRIASHCLGRPPPERPETMLGRPQPGGSRLGNLPRRDSLWSRRQTTRDGNEH